MSMLQIRVPDELKDRLTARAAESGYENVQAYVEALLRADAGEQQVLSDDELEALLLRRLDSGEGVEFTPDFVPQFKGELARRRNARGSR